MIYYKFFRPADPRFPADKTRITFDRMLVPPPNHETEKFCFAEIPENLFEQFLEDYGADGGELIEEKDMPDSFFNMVQQKNRYYTIVEPRGKY